MHPKGREAVWLWGTELRMECLSPSESLYAFLSQTYFLDLHGSIWLIAASQFTCFFSSNWSRKSWIFLAFISNSELGKCNGVFLVQYPSLVQKIVPKRQAHGVWNKGWRLQCYLLKCRGLVIYVLSSVL